MEFIAQYYVLRVEQTLSHKAPTICCPETLPQIKEPFCHIAPSYGWWPGAAAAQGMLGACSRGRKEAEGVTCLWNAFRSFQLGCLIETQPAFCLLLSPCL